MHITVSKHSLAEVSRRRARTQAGWTIQLAYSVDAAHYRPLRHASRAAVLTAVWTMTTTVGIHLSVVDRSEPNNGVSTAPVWSRPGSRVLVQQLRLGRWLIHWSLINRNVPQRRVHVFRIVHIISRFSCKMPLWPLVNKPPPQVKLRGENSLTHPHWSRPKPIHPRKRCWCRICRCSIVGHSFGGVDTQCESRLRNWHREWANVWRVSTQATAPSITICLSVPWQNPNT